MIRGGMDQTTMSTQLLTDMELAALLASRICHDLIAPIGALGNGMELLENEPDPAERAMTMSMLQNVAEQARAKLEFARLAFGAAGSMGTEIPMGQAKALAEELLAHEKRVNLHWAIADTPAPKSVVKLALNLLLLAMGCIPRGGTVHAEGGSGVIVMRAEGRKAALNAHAAPVLGGTVTKDELDAYKVQPYYTLRLLHESGFTLRVEEGEDVVTLSAAAA